MTMSNFFTFSNGITVFNSTPHPLSFQSPEGDKVIIPSSVPTGPWVINAKAQETVVRDDLVKTVFVADSEGEERILTIESWAKENGIKKLRVIGSMIAAQAYPGRVFGMIPAPGFERVPPDQKLMRVDKFTTFE